MIKTTLYRILYQKLIYEHILLIKKKIGKLKVDLNTI